MSPFRQTGKPANRQRRLTCRPIRTLDHYSESDLKLRAFTTSHLEPLLQKTLLPTAEQILATRDPLLQGVLFPAEVIDEVTAFMGALTDPAALALADAVPATVPSGLPVDGR